MSTSHMLSIRGINISFPCEPYQVQKDYMEKVLECLQEGVNGILESPTGTGKTLSLLCSALAWLETRKASCQAHLLSAGLAKEDKRGSGLWAQLESAMGVNSESNKYLVPKIIYSSRTHTQLSQAIQELKRTSYSYVSAVVLGSRDQLCLHPDVTKLPDNSSKLRACRAKIIQRSCPFHLNYDTKISSQSDYQEQTVVDIEDLAKLGKKHTCCPYYSSRNLKSKADVVFMPYNYLLDPKSRRAHGVELQGNVIIFDEAHNIESICEDSMSFQFKSADLALCIKEVTQAMEYLSTLGAEGSFSQDSSPSDFTAGELSILKTMLCELEEQLDKASLETLGTKNVKSGDFMLHVLTRVEITPAKKTIILDLLDKVIMFLETNSGSGGPWSSKGVGLQKFAEMIEILYSVDLGIHGSLEKEFASKFKVHILRESVKQRDTWTVTKSSKKDNWILDCWCFSPGLSMRNILGQGVHSIILTSGTLSPLSTFATELDIPFPVRLENPHIISDKQVFVAVVNQGPDGVPLSSAYENRSNEQYKKSLGRTIMNFARVVPDGVLVFFPSYSLMRNLVESWHENNVMPNICAQKPTLVEVQSKDGFKSIMDDYHKNIENQDSRGCILMAVCRGKVSEGMDFSDRYARAVVVTGLPFPPSFDPRVQLKKQYLDESSKSKELTGNAWYVLQASRAVNQAIGRAIRHKNDYGAVLLCDKRFGEPRNVNQLSKWVRPRVRVFQTFGALVKELVAFYKQAGNDLKQSLSISETKLLSGPGSEFQKPIQYKPEFTKQENSLMTASNVVNSEWDMNENVFNGYISTNLKGEKAKTHKGSVFDALAESESIPEKSVTFSGHSTIDFGSQDLACSQQPKRRKINVQLRTIEGNGTSESCEKPGCSKVAPSKKLEDLKERWKRYLAEIKITLGGTSEEFKTFCSAIRKFRDDTNIEEFAKCAARCLKSVSKREKLLKSTSQLVTESKRDTFIALCLSQW